MCACIITNPFSEDLQKLQQADAVARSSSGGRARNSPIPWRWPPACLDPASAIEVYVTDGTCQQGRWVEATPQERVVDDQGQDAYISAGYSYDGQCYVEDFGPERLRLRGATCTVHEQLLAVAKLPTAVGVLLDGGGGVSAQSAPREAEVLALTRRLRDQQFKLYALTSLLGQDLPQLERKIAHMMEQAEGATSEQLELMLEDSEIALQKLSNIVKRGRQDALPLFV